MILGIILCVSIYLAISASLNDVCVNKYSILLNTLLRYDNTQALTE